jgi:hypothetical protein
LALEAFGDATQDARVSLGLGTVRLSLVERVDAGRIAEAIQVIRATGRNVLLLSAPDALSGAVDAFGTPESTLQLMRQLKRQFDPWSALNPGRVIPEL